MAVPRVGDPSAQAGVQLKQGGTLNGRKVAPVSNNGNQEKGAICIISGALLLILGIIFLSVGASKTPKHMSMIRSGAVLTVIGGVDLISGVFSCAQG